jgi:hypothetical protein
VLTRDRLDTSYVIADEVTISDRSDVVSEGPRVSVETSRPFEGLRYFRPVGAEEGRSRIHQHATGVPLRG